MKSIDSKYTTELNTLKDDIKKIKSILGSIKVRNLAKNFLNRYSNHLTDEDKKIFAKEKKMGFNNRKGNRVIKRFLQRLY